MLFLNTKRLGHLLLTFAAVVCFTSSAFAAWPERAVKLIVPFNPGGGTDQQARLIEKEFQQEFGQPMTFIYKPGADGAIGGTEVADSKADGYTIAVYTFPLFYMNALTNKGRYTVDSFDYLAISSLDVPVLVTRKESDIKDLKDFIAKAKANPQKKLTVGTVETLGPSHIAALKLQQLGVPMNIVTMAGGSKGLVAVLGGHLDVLMTVKGAAQNSASSLKYLAVAIKERDAELSDVPTFSEEGLPATALGARIWVAPKGLPADIKQRLEEGFARIYSHPVVQERHAAAGQPITFGNGAELEKMVKTFAEEGPALLKMYNDSKK